ncbi:MAG TPA: glycoside hydrolase family 2 TIM barrel-domain containing protein [Thermoleophilaceae bacterium]|nr:glycoside hydrolase family 2 TIM barrel-domain containing protein [Thermoleophilaceae bacterium]
MGFAGGRATSTALALAAAGALMGAAPAPAQKPLADLLSPAQPPPAAPPAGGGEPGPPPPSEGEEPVTFRGPEGRISISSGWGFRPDARNEGLRRRWYRRMPKTSRVDLPHSPNAWPVTGPGGARNFRGSIGWYRKAIQITEPGRYAVRFESAHHRATVFVDGRRIADHLGAYLPFEVRPALAAGKHVITVRLDWRHTITLKRTGWHRAWFNYGGLNREVTLQRMGDSEVEATTIRTKLGEHAGEPLAMVDVSARVRNLTAAREVTVTGLLEQDGRRIEFDFPSVRLRKGERRTVRTRVPVLSPDLWSLSDPRLWRMQVGVPGEPGWQARVGLREIENRDGTPYLNGVPLFLRGASIHEEEVGRGDALSTAGMDAIVARLESLGANATRSQHPLHPALLERLDAAGILVWQQVGPFDSPGAWTSKTRELRRAAHRRVLTTLEAEQTHPSIFAWNLGNEVAWNGRRGGQAEYVDRAARALKRRDPGRLVALDVWGRRVPKNPGRMYRSIDAVGATNYIGWYEAPFAPEAEIARILSSRIAHMRSALPGRILVATEFGAEGNDRNPSGRHGGYGYQASLLASHLRAYRAMPQLSGMLVWNLTDFPLFPTYAGGSIVARVPRIRLTPGLNQKGLFDYRGNPKPAADTVRSEFTAPGR